MQTPQQIESALGSIIRLINSQHEKLDDVFERNLDLALEFCDAKFGILFVYDASLYRAVAYSNITDAFRSWLSGR